MTALLVGEKCSCTPSTLRFFASLRLALEQNCLFPDGHYFAVQHEENVAIEKTFSLQQAILL